LEWHAHIAAKISRGPPITGNRFPSREQADSVVYPSLGRRRLIPSLEQVTCRELTVTPISSAISSRLFPRSTRFLTCWILSGVNFIRLPRGGACELNFASGAVIKSWWFISESPFKSSRLASGQLPSGEETIARDRSRRRAIFMARRPRGVLELANASQ
jgi:hypothetical protein